MERYPYLKSKLVEKNGDFYIADNRLSVPFAKTDIRRAGFRRTLVRSILQDIGSDDVTRLFVHFI